MRRIGLVHPLLFGIFPVLFLYAQNAQSMSLSDIGPSLLLICIALTILIPVAGLIMRNFEKGALALTILTILFFSYGHIVDILPQFRFLIGISTIGPNGVVLPIYCLLLFLGLRFVVRTKRDLGPITKILAQLGLLLVVVQIAHGGYIIASRPEVQPAEPMRTINRADLPDKLPDIYYIVMDAYGREDILKSVYGVDISDFIAFLRERGFYVADNSYSNYTITLNSLSATLNLDYVQNVQPIDPESRDRIPLARRLWNNKVFKQLESLGYTTVAFSPTGSSYTESIKADVVLQTSGGRSEFQSLLMSTLPLPLFLSQDLSEEEAHRRLVLYMMDKIPKITEAKSPKFVFAHVFCPHKPFVFGSDGGPNENVKPLAVAGSSNFRNQYIDCYSDQVTYITKRLQQVIEEILKLSPEDPPIIIVQGDHGPRAGMNWYDMNKTNLKEVLSILNAIYLPGTDYKNLLYNDMSPVNTFRILFNEYFNGRYDMLPNEHYYATEYRPFRFEKVSKEQLAESRNIFDYLLSLDFDSLATLDRMILMAKGLIDRPLAECYAGGKPQMSFADGALEMADSRLTKLTDDQYLFEAAFNSSGSSRSQYSIELCFYPADSGQMRDSLQLLGRLKQSFEVKPGSMKLIGKALILSFAPEKYTVSIFSDGQPVKSNSHPQPFFINVKQRD